MTLDELLDAIKDVLLGGGIGAAAILSLLEIARSR